MSTFLRLALLYCLGAFVSADAATFTFRFNGNGFTDTTPFVPVGGNNATTLGQARSNLLLEAGRIWGALLVSNVPIKVDVQFSAQECTATTGTLASAGARTFFRDFLPPPTSPNTFFASALADSLAGTDLMQETGTPNDPDIRVTFNLSVDTDAGCLGGRGFYYGFDSNEGTRIDALAVALHELAHGFGFSSEIDLDDGTGFNSNDGVARFSTYVMQIFDETLGRSWPMLSPAERVTSATGNMALGWNGSNVNNRFVPLAAGVTSQGRLRLFAPTPVSEGSSISHWTTLASPNLLMEPNISRDLTNRVDVTVCALRDIGWQTTRCPDGTAAVSPNAPTAMSQTVAVVEDSSVAITLMATDPDANSTLTFNTSTPAKGALTGSTATRTYAPRANLTGADSFIFTADDGGNTSAPATVVINITPVNDPPSASGSTLNATSGRALAIPLIGSDVDGDTVTFEMVSSPANGTGSVSPNGTLTYQSNDRFTGLDSLTFQVRDASTTSNIATVTINVTPSSAPTPGGRGGGGGAMNELLLLALGLLALTARMYNRRLTAPERAH